MTDDKAEYVNPNKPFRFFRTFRRDWGPGGSYPDFISMPSEGLRDLALALLEDRIVGPIFRRAGIHGDIGADEESAISDFVERYVAEHGWEKPDPSNLVISTVLARRLAGGSMSRDDEKAAIEFIADRRCDGLDSNAGVGSRRRLTPLTAPEVIPILQWLDIQEDLKAPFTALRGRVFRRGQNYFSNEDNAFLYYLRIKGAAVQVAVHKYALENRDLRSFDSRIADIVGMYADGKIDHFDEKKAVDWVVRSKLSNNSIDSAKEID